MTANRRTVDSNESYTNPVYPHSFPDPFVFKYCGEYFAICTGFDAGGGVFPLLRSTDLVKWESIGVAMQPLADSPPFYWAPEITYDNGKFYLYYSVGNEALMEIRVAVSDCPGGGYVDSGVRLTNEVFAIDPHVFIDEDGGKYLFYATDFLEHTHIGTGTVVDTLPDWFKLGGNPSPVTRAKYDWQIYDPQRKEKGGVRWHTVEGPAVIKRKNRYFEMFSGGNWQNTSYGVSFASSLEIYSTEEWDQFSDGDKTLPILLTIPERVTGPGHNSIVRGPNNRELYCVYHSWTDKGRVMAIDRMDFAGNRIFVHGATFNPQIAPFRPVLETFRDWEQSGGWSETGKGVQSVLDARCEFRHRTENESFLCEVSFRCGEFSRIGHSAGFRLFSGDNAILELSLFPDTNQVMISLDEREQSFDLPSGFDAAAFHLLRVEVDGGFVKVGLDTSAFNTEQQLSHSADRLSFFTKDVKTEFTGFALTEGYEDLFTWNQQTFETSGWRKLSEICEAEIVDQALRLSSSRDLSIVTKGRPLSDLEFAANIKLGEHSGNDWELGLAFLDDDDKMIFRLSVKPNESGIVLSTTSGAETLQLEMESIPEYNQLRLIKMGGNITAYLDSSITGTGEIKDIPVRCAIFCCNSSIDIEMVRVTALF